VAVYGTPDQKDEIIPSLQEGRLIGAVAISEDAMNIENDPLNTSAVNNNEGFLVSGSKGHVVNGPIADWIAVAAKTGDGLAFFLSKKRQRGWPLVKGSPCSDTMVWPFPGSLLKIALSLQTIL